MIGNCLIRFCFVLYVFALSEGGVKKSYNFALRENNMILTGHMVAEKLNISILKCAVMCTMNLDCLSLNYYKLERRCEINSVAADQFPEDLVPRENGYYICELDGKLKGRQSPSSDAIITASATTQPATAPTTNIAKTTQPMSMQLTTVVLTTTATTTAEPTTTQPTTTDVAKTTQPTTTQLTTVVLTTTAEATTSAEPTTTQSTTTAATTNVDKTTQPMTTQLTTVVTTAEATTTAEPTTTQPTKMAPTTQSITTAIEYPATVVMQSRSTGDLNFSRSWQEYVDGFSNATESWIGLEYVHQMTSTVKCGLLIEMEYFEGYSYYATFRQFEVGNAETNYRIVIGGYAGTAGDASSTLTGLPFSTGDNDHSTSGSLMSMIGGGWWVADIAYTNLNGVYQPLGDSPGMGQGIFWIFAPSGSKISFFKSRMTIKQLSFYPTDDDLAPESDRTPAGDSDAAVIIPIG